MSKHTDRAKAERHLKHAVSCLSIAADHTARQQDETWCLWLVAQALANRIALGATYQPQLEAAVARLGEQG